MADATIFVNRESGARATVQKVTDTYADISGVTPDGRAFRFQMPIGDYDGTSPNSRNHFATLWRQATAEDLVPAEDFRLPANMMVDREAPDGVQISPELDD